MLMTGEGARDWPERHLLEPPCLVSPRYQHLLGRCPASGLPTKSALSLLESRVYYEIRRHERVYSRVHELFSFEQLLRPVRWTTH
jgi:hypothetical protein